MNVQLRSTGRTIDRRTFIEDPRQNKPVHPPQTTIFPVLGSCEGACKNYGMYLGTCFLLQDDLQKVFGEAGSYYYFATAGHILICNECRSYRSIRIALDWTPGDKRPNSYLCAVITTDIENFNGWLRVPAEYQAERTGDVRLRYLNDFGVIAVRKASCFGKARAVIANCRKECMQAAESRPDGRGAYLCGYPVCAQEAVFDRTEPRNYEQLLDFAQNKKVIAGLMMWMPPSTRIDDFPPSESESVRARCARERSTTAVYEMPQHHSEDGSDKEETAMAAKRLYRYYIDTSSGQAGSPVYVTGKDDGGEPCYYVLGIHLGAWPLPSRSPGASDVSCNICFSMKTALDQMRAEAWPQLVERSLPESDMCWEERKRRKEDGLVPEKVLQTSGDLERPPAQHSPDPWLTAKYTSIYSGLLEQMRDGYMRAKCVALEMIRSSTSESIAEEIEPQRRNAILIDSISKTRENFGKFREILRADETGRCDDFMQDLDSVRPDPEEFQHVAQKLDELHWEGVKAATQKVLQEMSQEDRRAYQRALKEGDSPIVHGRIILVGPGRGGKSALLRSLLHKVFNELKSTVGIDVEKVCCYLSSKDGKISFEVYKSNRKTVQLACSVTRDKLMKDGAPSASMPSDESMPMNASSLVIESPPVTSAIGDSWPLSSYSGSDMQRALPADDLLPSRTPAIDSKMSDKLDTFIDELYATNILDSDSLDCQGCLDLWDFAGQKPFQTLGPMFFRGERCCFIAVFDAKKMLQNETYRDIFNDEDGEDEDLAINPTTYLENFENWLNIIHQVAGEDSPVYVVGTHADLLHEERQAEEVKSRIKDSAKKKDYESNLKDIFLLTNKGSGTDKEDPKLQELREEVLESAKKKFEMQVPIKWLPFSVVARRFADSHNEPILSAADTGDLARKACRDPDVEVSALLKFYETLGQVLQYDTNVVIDTSWLVKVVSSVFSPVKDGKQEPAYKDQYRKLFDHGILSESLAIHRWGENTHTKELSTNPEKRAVIFQLLAHYKLLYEMNDGDASASIMDKQHKYLVPFLVRNLSIPPPDCSERLTPPHYILCEERTVFPEISFWCSVVSLMKEYKLWHVDLAMYRDQAQLTVDDCFQLRLRHMSRGIQMTVGDEEGDFLSWAEKSNEIVDKLLQSNKHVTASSQLQVHLYHAVSCLCAKIKCDTHSVAGCLELGCLHFSLHEDGKKYQYMRCPLPGNHCAKVADPEELLCFWLPADCKVRQVTAASACPSSLTGEKDPGLKEQVIKFLDHKRKSGVSSGTVTKGGTPAAAAAAAGAAAPAAAAPAAPAAPAPAPAALIAAAAAPAPAPAPAAATAATAAAPPAAVAEVKKPSADRSKNPWVTKEYKSKYYFLLTRMDDPDFRAKCYTFEMISDPEHDSIAEEMNSQRRKERLLSIIKTTPENFGKFREILRTDSINKYADFMADLDSVGPDPEDQEFREIRAKLQ